MDVSWVRPGISNAKHATCTATDILLGLIEMNDFDTCGWNERKRNFQVACGIAFNKADIYLHSHTYIFLKGCDYTLDENSFIPVMPLLDHFNSS